MYLSPILSLLLVFILNDSLQETIHFDVVRNEKIIGELVAIKSHSDGLITYSNSTNITSRVFKDISICYQFDVVMIQNKLDAANAMIEVNGRVRNHTIIKRVENQYEIQRKGERKKRLAEPVTYPAILLLFQEPINIKKSFYEETGDFHTLHSMGNHSYKKVNSSGKENWYYYQNGKLQRAVIDAGIVQFEIVLRD